MKLFSPDTFLQNFSVWAAQTEESIRVRVEQQSEKARNFDYQRLHPTQLVKAWQKSSFESKVKAGETVYNTLIQMARRSLHAQRHEVSLKDGNLVYWATHKKGLETILYLHGFGDSKDGVYSLAFSLAAHYNIIAVDLPGFGESFCHPHLDYSAESYGRWLDEFLTRIASGPIHVVGNSLGGAIGIKLATVRPDLVQSLCLLNSAGIVDHKHGSIYDELLRGENLFQVKTLEEFQLFWDRVFHRRPYLPPFVKLFIFDKFRKNHDWYGQLVRQSFGEIRRKSDPRYKKLFMNDHLTKLRVPSLIIWGDQDRLFPVVHGQKGHKLSKNAQFIVLKQVGHAPQVEVPRLVARHLHEFIQGLQKTKQEA